MTARRVDVATTVAGVRLAFCAMNAAEAAASAHELRPLVTSRTGAIVLRTATVHPFLHPEFRSLQERLTLPVQLLGERPGRLQRHVACGGRRPEQREPLAHRCVDALLEERHEEFLLPREVPVKRPLRVARLGGDLIDAGLAVAAAREDPQRRRQELVASLAPSGACGAGALVETPSAVATGPARWAGSARLA